MTSHIQHCGPELGHSAPNKSQRMHIYLALPPPAGGGARPGLPFLARLGLARFDERPAVPGKVEEEICDASTGRDAGMSEAGGAVGTLVLARLERASTCISSLLAAKVAGSMATLVADSSVAMRFLGRSLAIRSKDIC